MIRNIVLDMGGVVIRFDRERFIRRLGVVPEDEQLLMNGVFRSLEWAMMDRGTITEGEAAAAIRPRLPARLHDAAEKLICMWERPILPVSGMYALIEELKGLGYPVYLLSNASLRQHEYWPRVPASKFFDGTLISADVRLVKPQPEIYRLFCDTFGLAIGECFFVDDSPQNVEGACFAGMSGFVFNGDTDAPPSPPRQRGSPLPAAPFAARPYPR